MPATASFRFLQIFFICFLDVVMIVSGVSAVVWLLAARRTKLQPLCTPGFASYKGTSGVGIWPLFVFSCIMQIAVLGTLVRHLYASGTSPDVHPVENRV